MKTKNDDNDDDYNDHDYNDHDYGYEYCYDFDNDDHHWW